MEVIGEGTQQKGQDAEGAKRRLGLVTMDYRDHQGPEEVGRLDLVILGQ